MLEKTKVSEILKDKGKAIVSVDPGATVFEALSLMAERNTGAVLVMSDDQFAAHDFAHVSFA
jgi:CBS domain-containing protein